MNDEEARIIALQKDRCYDLLRTARDLRKRARAAEAQAEAIAKSWQIALDKAEDRL